MAALLPGMGWRWSGNGGFGNGELIVESSRTSRTANLIAVRASPIPVAAPPITLTEARGFEPGHELDDWIAAEQQIGLTFMPGSYFSQSIDDQRKRGR